MDHDRDSLPLATLVLRRLRAILLLLLAAQITGVAAELVLIAHWEDIWQWTPIVLLGIGLLTLAVHAILRNRASLRAFKLVMVLFLFAGCLGTWLHYDGRTEFRQEVDPSLAGWNLFRAAMTGSSTPPVLAPGIMVQMGLLGLACLYRHPAGGTTGNE